MAVRAKIWFSGWLLLSSAALAQQQSTIQVGVVPAEKRALADTNRFVGRIEAIERVDIRARVTGFLEKVEFKDGDRVKEGALLYRIEKGPFEAAVQQAKAAVEKARAVLENANLQKQRADELIKTNAISQATRDDRNSAAIIATLVELARKLGMDTVAEGVEHFEQVVELRRRGIRSAQGFIFAPALPVGAYVQLVDSLNPAAKGDTKVDADEALQAVVDEAQKAVA